VATTTGLNIYGFSIDPKKWGFIDWVLIVALIILLIMVGIVLLSFLFYCIRFAFCHSR
jgi:multisubunit Na+/H+ antiporter MnhB subunit